MPENNIIIILYTDNTVCVFSMQLLKLVGMHRLYAYIICLEFTIGVPILRFRNYLLSCFDTGRKDEHRNSELLYYNILMVWNVIPTVNIVFRGMRKNREFIVKIFAFEHFQTPKFYSPLFKLCVNERYAGDQNQWICSTKLALLGI